MSYDVSTPEGRAEVRRLARSVASACDCDDPRTMEPCAHCWQVSRTLFAALEELERLRGITPELPDRPPDGQGTPRYGIRWNGPTEPMAVPMEDGYWTPWHLANREIGRLERELAERAGAWRSPRYMGHW